MVFGDEGESSKRKGTVTVARRGSRQAGFPRHLPASSDQLLNRNDRGRGHAEMAPRS
jgi:hypothetical protein